MVSNRFCRIRRWPAVALLALASSVALAGPGFIHSSRVAESASGSDIEIRFNCKAQYLRHEPQGGGDYLRIYLEPTSICNGVSPLVTASKSRLRPFNSDSAQLDELEYDGDAALGAVLTLNFSDPVTFDVEMTGVSFELTVHVDPATTVAMPTAVQPTVTHRQVVREQEAAPEYVINLQSFRRIPTIADAPNLRLQDGQRLFYSEVVVDGSTWFRLRLGDFESDAVAASALAELKSQYPGAWVDQLDPQDTVTELTAAVLALASAAPASDVQSEPSGNAKVDSLMEEARKLMVSGDTSRAVQIYTKILQLPAHTRQPQAQEYLALAREKNGQLAHAKAEYQRYLSLYPDNEGAARVSQRLAVLLAGDQRAIRTADANATGTTRRSRAQGDWRVQTYFSQYYRRDENQQNDQEEIVSQSALYSDVNFDARRRGERFDFSSRISAGYRNDFLDENVGSGNELRVSYAYADLADAATGLRARVGRQSRNSGGVLGRFDGLNVGYEVGERVLLNAVVGSPAYSASDGTDSARTFYGASVTYGPILDDLELGMYVIQQDIEGIDDRQAVGTEFRYFGENQSIWGLVDYDTLYNELGSAYLQASYRFASRLTLHGSIDQRHSPFLSVGNALIGQPVFEFAQLLELLPVEEIRQLSIDRSPLSTTYSAGLSSSLTPKLQINADVNQTSIDATPASGGVAATPATEYRYYSANVVASSLFREGDVTIIGARYSDSDTARVISMTLDSRYPIGRSLRINPRLRVDRRQRLADSSYEWLYTPGIRVQYRRSQKFRIEFEAGKQYSQRETAEFNLDRESFFINLGYQAFF